MQMQILQILLVPLVFVFITYYVGNKWGSKAGYLSFIALAYSTFLTLVAGWQGGGQEFYNWSPIGLFGLKLDGLSIPILFIIELLCTLMSLYSIPYMPHIIGEKTKQFGLYYALFLLYSVGMMGAVMATNLIEFYLFFELMLIPSYFLIAKWGYGDRDRISFMYFMWTHIGALSLLAGILWLGFLAGTPGQPIFDLGKIVVDNTPGLASLGNDTDGRGPFGEDGNVWLAHLAAQCTRRGTNSHQRFAVTGDDRYRGLCDSQNRNVHSTNSFLSDIVGAYNLGGCHDALRRRHGPSAR